MVTSVNVSVEKKADDEFMALRASDGHVGQILIEEGLITESLLRQA